nr:hypothetical protein Q903MT_gene3381 [Picea sitchensis]
MGLVLLVLLLTIDLDLWFDNEGRALEGNTKAGRSKPKPGKKV